MSFFPVILGGFMLSDIIQSTVHYSTDIDWSQNRFKETDPLLFGCMNRSTLIF
jgi:hypothetical protein